MNRRVENPVGKRCAPFPALLALALLLGGCVTQGDTRTTAGMGGSARDERPVVGLQHDGPVRVVYQMTADEWKDGVGKGLLYLRNLHRGYIDAGVGADNLKIHAVFHGAAAVHLLTDSAWNGWQEDSGGNPNTELIAELTRRGVAVELCDTRRVANGWSKADIHPDVILVGGAYQRIIDLQLRGFAYIRF